VASVSLRPYACRFLAVQRVQKSSMASALTLTHPAIIGNAGAIL
jgi:hypothetical protein